MRVLFAELLKRYEINRLYLSPLKKQFLHICEALNDSDKENRLTMQQSVSALNAKVEKLEERFAFGEIDRKTFEKVGGKLKQEIKVRLLRFVCNANLPRFNFPNKRLWATTE